jgi:CHAD domain-containing protein
MSYRLTPGESLPQGAKRIALEQIEDALDQLLNPGDDIDKSVHESRKCFKKLRGLLRLFRLEMGEKAYQRENRCFRDAGRLLSDLRDSAVRIKILDSLADSLGESVNTEGIASLRKSFVIFYQATFHRVVEEENALSEAAEMVQLARHRVATWPIEQDTFVAVEGGLRKIYKRGRNRWHDACENQTTDNLHEWRKRVKYLWYSTRILQPIWPTPMEVLADEIHDLSDYLGDDHDLAGIRAMLTHEETLVVNDTFRDALLAQIENERSELQRRALRQGKRIYTEAPNNFVHRLRGYWLATLTNPYVDDSQWNSGDVVDEVSDTASLS